MAVNGFHIGDIPATVPILPKDMPEYLGTDDPVVMKTSWNPLSENYRLSKSHTLVRINDSRLEFRRSAQSYFMAFLFVATGGVLILLSFAGKLGSDGNPAVAILSGLFFAAIGVFLFILGNKRIVLDKTVPALWRGNLEPSKVVNRSAVDGYRSLKDVHAVQILQQYVNSSDADNNGKSYDNHEINLIFSDGKRAPLVSHGDAEAITAQADRISEFLGIPLWDGRSNATLFSTFLGSGAEKAINFLLRARNLYRKSAIILFLLIVGAALYSKFFSHTPEAEVTPETKMQNTEKIFAMAKDPMLHKPEFKSVLQSGANINAKDRLGRTPLFYAVMNKNDVYTFYLLAAGADTGVRDNEGKSVMDLVDKHSDADRYIVFLLEQHPPQQYPIAQ